MSLSVGEDWAPFPAELIRSEPGSSGRRPGLVVPALFTRRLLGILIAGSADQRNTLELQNPEVCPLSRRAISAASLPLWLGFPQPGEPGWWPWPAFLGDVHGGGAILGHLLLGIQFPFAQAHQGCTCSWAQYVSVVGATSSAGTHCQERWCLLLALHAEQQGLRRKLLRLALMSGACCVGLSPWWWWLWCGTVPAPPFLQQIG